MEPVMLPIKFTSMSTGEARAYQAGALDANGQVPERHISDGDGVPCRHCQRAGDELRRSHGRDVPLSAKDGESRVG